MNHFTNVFTIPDGMYLQQDDQPEVDPYQGDEDEEGDGDPPESFMYFIRTGQFEVTIKSNFSSGEKEKDHSEFKKRLYDGDHFGEIGIIFGSKRTATVKSTNYGSLALLKESGFKVLQGQFPNMI